MTLLYYDPIRRMQQLMQALFPEEMTRTTTDVRQAGLVIPLNVFAEEDAFVIQAWVPGLNAEDLHIEVVGDTVTLEGEFKGPEHKENLLLQEIPVGRFKRVITLPTELEADEAEAELVNGVLTLRIPKAKALRPKEIKVKVRK